jgi:hypothetical protein
LLLWNVPETLQSIEAQNGISLMGWERRLPDTVTLEFAQSSYAVVLASQQNPEKTIRLHERGAVSTVVAEHETLLSTPEDLFSEIDTTKQLSAELKPLLRLPRALEQYQLSLEELELSGERPRFLRGRIEHAGQQRTVLLPIDHPQRSAAELRVLLDRLTLPEQAELQEIDLRFDHPVVRDENYRETSATASSAATATESATPSVSPGQ